MFRILLVFGIPAIGAFFLGRWADATYNMRPYGSMLAILGAAAISWAITIRIYINLTKEYKKLDKLEKEKEKTDNV